MNAQQRRLLLWCLLACAIGTHLWFCRWGERPTAGMLTIRLVSTSPKSDAAVVARILADGADRGQRLSQRSTPMFPPSSEPPDEFDTALERELERRDQLLIWAFRRTHATEPDHLNSEQVCLLLAAERERKIRFAQGSSILLRMLEDPDFRYESNPSFELRKDPEFISLARQARFELDRTDVTYLGLHTAIGCSPDDALVGGIFVPIAALAAALFLRLGGPRASA